MRLLTPLKLVFCFHFDGFDSHFSSDFLFVAWFTLR